MSKRDRSRDTTIRISKTDRDRLEKIKGELSMRQFFSKVADLLENQTIDNLNLHYYAAGKFHDSIEIARGEAILDSQLNESEQKIPEIYLYLGADKG
jgi:hypothetical protein